MPVYLHHISYKHKSFKNQIPDSRGNNSPKANTMIRSIMNTKDFMKSFEVLAQEVHIQVVKHVSALGSCGGALLSHLGHVSLEHLPPSHHLLLALV